MISKRVFDGYLIEEKEISLKKRKKKPFDFYEVVKITSKRRWGREKRA